MDALNIILVFVGAVIGSMSSSSVLLHILKRKDVTEKLVVKNNRLGEAVNLLLETEMVLIDALHNAKIINGDGESVKKKIEDYLTECTKNGFMLDD